MTSPWRERRESYLAGSMSVVEKARQADGCLDFAITADLLDPGRVNLQHDRATTDEIGAARSDRTTTKPTRREPQP